jgi:hypothetical protein
MKFGKALLALTLCATLTFTACSTAWISEAEQIVVALIPAAANIVALAATLQGKNVSANDLETIQKAGTQAGILNQIEAATNAAQSAVDGLLPALHIEDATTQAKVTAVVGIVLSEIQSLAAIVPLIDPSTSPGVMAMASRQVKKLTPLTASEFVSSYNATMTAKTGNAALDHATAGLRIHVHGELARWASAGLLK